MVVFKSKREIDIPRLDLLSLLFDSDWCLALEETKIHVQAANPANSITKAESRKLLKRVAYVLRHQFGIGASGPGTDVVLTVLSGSPFAPVFFYGIVAAGGIFSGASTEYRVEELTRQIEDGKATLLVCSPECEARVVQAAEACGIARDRILILDGTIPHSWKLISVADQSDLLERSGGKMLDWQRITDQRTLEKVTTCLLYSSGTTGLPKGIRLSHWALVSNNVCTMDVARRYRAHCQKEGRKFAFNTIAHLPMSNIAGISLYSTNPFYMGGTTWWMEKYDFDSFLEYHRRYRPAYQFSVPPVWLRIAKSDKVTDHFDALQVAVTGAAPIGEDIVREVRKKLGRGQAHMAQTWGTTETTGVITATDWPAYAKDGTWSVGELCPNVTLRVVDEDGQDLPEGQRGELLVGGPILAQAYHNRQQATMESFQDGFYRTGDIGTYTDGHVRIVDRKKELIKYKGSQVAPAELEALLTSHPRIADAAVIGLWDEQQQTEVPRAYVVSRPQTVGGSITAQEVADFVKSKVASYKQLRGGVFFVDEIPKSASGKILRKELRSRIKPSSSIQAKL
ncbi:uncharacterized protein Z520_06327 [Fonsecaea multimorphosa CBS 102226]|uniref:AMP-dependent synthetase/ligase domain-containing protein n=1 Tax=Fonsecaea multimorphosa CBS 102226 TaxID=1442371 RepID=A0A0D2JXG5_9EURO|nr:uncharacterized protein Z520_06327 [Fonsecaea multimorphosa CBS 102226]KIX98247.1 hypothetical protein Z520_06327 [Fonsecaea multimorphosa CBS 102226]OAL22620.1 hypothetical protein AYO22_07178 [Fonsecaea multimorphosa]